VRPSDVEPSSQRPPASIRPPRRPFRLLVTLAKTLAVEPRFWRGHVWKSLRLAREAQRRGAMQKVAELAPLLALLTRQRPRAVVEIGTYRGGCLYAFCRVAAPDASVVSVDLPGGLFGGGYDEDELVAIRGYALPGQTLHLLARDSQEDSTRDAVAGALEDRPVDFLMIDGDHRYEAVRRDFELYSQLVRPGGLIAFHDILPHPQAPLSEVDRFWQEVNSGYRHLELVDPAEDWGVGQWGGIGILFWPG
jgi:predicted O-methyltransferase YrrM